MKKNSGTNLMLGEVLEAISLKVVFNEVAF